MNFKWVCKDGTDNHEWNANTDSCVKCGIERMQIIQPRHIEEYEPSRLSPGGWKVKTSTKTKEEREKEFLENIEDLKKHYALRRMLQK
jgi:hypothetical protein